MAKCPANSKPRYRSRPNRRRSWSGQDTGTRYRVERDTGAGWERAGQADQPASTYADTVTATQAVTVQYRVMDCEDDACSAASNTASVDLNP